MFLREARLSALDCDCWAKMAKLGSMSKSRCAYSTRKSEAGTMSVYGGIYGNPRHHNAKEASEGSPLWAAIEEYEGGHH
eukprot:1590196-Amphidinium_carterae.1